MWDNQRARLKHGLAFWSKGLAGHADKRVSRQVVGAAAAFDLRRDANEQSSVEALGGKHLGA